MTHKQSFFVAGTVLIAALTSTAHAMPFSDDFNDGNADGWFEIDASGGLGSFDASSGMYHLTTDAATPVSPGGGLLIPVWTDSFADPIAFSNGFVRAIVEVGTERHERGCGSASQPGCFDRLYR